MIVTYEKKVVRFVGMIVPWYVNRLFTVALIWTGFPAGMEDGALYRAARSPKDTWELLEIVPALADQATCSLVTR